MAANGLTRIINKMGLAKLWSDFMLLAVSFFEQFSVSWSLDFLEKTFLSLNCGSQKSQIKS